MQKSSSTGKLAGQNVNKFKSFYENLSASDLKSAAEVLRPNSKNVQPAKSVQTNHGLRKSPSKPPLPSKPIIAPKPTFANNSGKFRSKSCDVTPPNIAPKPVRCKSSFNCNVSEENRRDNGHHGLANRPEQTNGEGPVISQKQANGQEQASDQEQNGHCNGTGDENQEVSVTEEKEEADMNSDRRNGEEDEDEAWESDEFDESDNDSDEPEESLPNKRQSRLIFGELHDIPDLDYLDPRRRKLFNIAKEILTTEVTYVKTLKLLDEVFHFTIKTECEAKGIVPKEALLEIFSNITTINQFHRDFLLPKLEERMKNWDKTPKVGDVFNFLAPFLKMYAEYVKNFDQAMSSLSKWKQKSPKFAGVVENIQKTNKECNNLTLEHHMLAPVQRVPRYKLLLTDYISKLPEDSPDLEESKKSLEIISAAAIHANESMKKTERFQKMLEIQEKFGDGVSIVTPSREFIMEGELIKISARNAHDIMTRTLVLFNDSLYYCTKVSTTNKYKVKQIVELLSTHIESPDDDIAKRDLVFRVRSRNKVADFQATSVEQKDKWVSTLTEAIDNAVKRNSTFGRGETINETDLGKIAPVWVRDDAVTMCMACTTAFRTLRRRHHCRACGKIVCSNCSSNKIKLEYSNKVERVCVNCYKVLKQDGTLGTIRRKTKIQKFADTVLVGYLNFRSDNTKAWSKRWCMLGDDFTLHVFKAKKDVKAQTTIPLPGYVIGNENSNEENDKNGKRVFRVFHKGLQDSYWFEADNDELLEQWLKHVECALKAEPYPERTSTNSDVSSPPPSPD